MNAEQLKELLDKYQQGNASTREQSMVEAYLILADKSATNFSSDTERLQTQHRLWDKLHAGVQPVVAKRINIRRRLMSVAAACFVVCLTAGLAYKMRYEILDAVDPIADKTVTTNAYETRQVLLPDSSVVTLAQNSRISFKERYRGSKRTVELDGVAFFTITKDSLHPFVVSSQSLNVQVLGTSFEVNDSKGADNAVVSVLAGKVQVRKGDKKLAILTPGQMVQYNNRLQQMELSDFSIDSAALWRNSRYIFNDTPLDAVLETLRKHTHVSIMVDESIVTSKYVFAGSFSRDESIREMLDVVCFSAGLQYTMPDTSHAIIKK